jgi:hypothetical protein
LFWARIQGLFGSDYGLFNLGVLGQFCMLVNSAHKDRSIRVTFKNYLNTYNLNFSSFEDNYFWNFHFNVWEWFLHSSVLERTESDLSKINWLRGVILLLSDLFRLSGTRSQSWLWVAWPRDHEVRISNTFVSLQHIKTYRN